MQIPYFEEKIIDITNKILTQLKNTYPNPRSTILNSLVSRLENKPFIEIQARGAIFVGDLHGDLDSLLNAVELYRRYIKKGYILVFLGDYVDRGPRQLETFFGTLYLKYSYPENIFLVRGNHEIPSINLRYGFAELLKSIYRDNIWIKIFKTITRTTYPNLPLTIGIRLPKTSVIALHGGPPLNFERLRQLPAEIEPKDNDVIEVLWSDPSPIVNGRVFNPRGAGSLYGKTVVEQFLDFYSYDILVRAHQAVEKGVNVSFDGKLYTVFSCRYYDIEPAILVISGSGNKKTLYIRDPYSIEYYDNILIKQLA